MTSGPGVPPAGPGVLGSSGQWLGMAGARALAFAAAGLVAGVAVTAPLIVTGVISFGGAPRTLGVFACPDGLVKLADIPVGQRVLVTGVNADRSWLQIDFPAPAIERAWVRAQPFTPQGDLSGLPVTTCTTPQSAAVATPTPAPTPSPAPTPTPEPTPGPTPTASPTGTPSPTPTPGATPTPRPTPTAGPTTRPTPTPTPRPSATPTAKPTATPTQKPTATPAPTATATPTPPIIASVTWDQKILYLPPPPDSDCDPDAPNTIQFRADLFHDPTVVEVDLVYKRPSDADFQTQSMFQVGDQWRTALTTTLDAPWAIGRQFNPVLAFYVTAVNKAKVTVKWPATGSNPTVPVRACLLPSFAPIP